MIIIVIDTFILSVNVRFKYSNVQFALNCFKINVYSQWKRSWLYLFNNQSE